MGLIRSSARCEAGQRPATAARRTHSASEASGWENGESLWSRHRSARSQWLGAPIRCTCSSRVGRCDASLPTSFARGSAVVVRRVCGLRGRISGSERRRDAQTPGGQVPRNPPGSRGSRNHIARRCIPAFRSDSSDRAGRSPAPRAAPRPPPRRHWTAPRRRGIKGLQSCLRRRCAPRARGSTPIKLPGPSSICVSHLQHSRNG